jgi:uncharacterized protein (TIGR02466 family)
MKVEFLNLFPCPFIRIDTNPEFLLIKENLIKYIYDNREKYPKGIVRSNNGGWHSDIYLNKEESFKPYSDFILSHIMESCNLFFNREINANLLSCWANINGKGSSNDMHLHPGADMSGCIWIKTKDNSGDLIFKNPFDYDFYSWQVNFNTDQKSQSYFSSSYYFNPVEGGMLLFPSSLMHKVSENKSNEDRISIAFNLKITDFN